MANYTQLNKAELIKELATRDNEINTLNQTLATEKEALLSKETEITSLNKSLEVMTTPESIIASMNKLGKEAKQKLTLSSRNSTEGYQALIAFMYGI